jgi:hypothetical protein
MTKKELKELNLQTDHGIFSPTYTYENHFIDEETGEEIYEGIVIVETAEEVYQNWLNQDKTNNLSENEKLRKELLATQKMLVDLQTEVLLNQI